MHIYNHINTQAINSTFKHLIASGFDSQMVYI